MGEWEAAAQGGAVKNDYIVRKTYLSFVVASILSSLTATAGMLIDNIIVGQALGSQALGAMGIVGPVSLAFSAIGNICSSGGGARAAQALGRGDTEKMCRIFTNNTLFVLLSGGFFTLFGLLFAPQIAELLGARGALLEPSTAYLYGYFLGALPTIMLSAMMSFVRIDGSPRLPLVCIGVMTAANITLDLLMVYVFHQGMFGMALATTISYCLAVATAFLHFLKKESTLRFVRPKRFFGELSQNVVTGFPTAVSRICDTLKVSLINNMLTAYVSLAAVTAMSVRTQANNFLGALVLGVGQAATPTVGMFFGEEDRTAVRDTLKTTFRVGFCLVIPVAAALCAFPSLFAKLLGLDGGGVLALSETALRSFALGLPLYLMNNVLMSFYQCTQRVGLATAICVLQSLVYTLALSFLLVRPMGADGVWLALLLGEAATLLTVFLYTCIRNKKISLSVSSLMMLEANFGGNPEDRLELSIPNSMEALMRVATGIYRFGEKRGMDEKALHTLSLCIEEMAGNVVEHAFKPGEKRYLDLTLVDRGAYLLLRLRDNGAAFDPLAYLSARKKEDYGIRLVHALADGISYRRSMGLNNLVIRLRKEKQRQGPHILQEKA